MDYVERISRSGDLIAIAVKLADLRHNSDISRLDTIDEKMQFNIEKYNNAINILEGHWYLNRNGDIYIEKVAATGLWTYDLYIDGTRICGSNNLAMMTPNKKNNLLQTDVYVESAIFTTHGNPAYEGITIVPGLKLEYPVYDDKNQNPIAFMKKTFLELPFLSTFCQYRVIRSKHGNPHIYINTEHNTLMNTAIIETIPGDSFNVVVSIYPDESFEYDPLSLVEGRYTVSIDQKHLQWLPHVFHAYMLMYKCYL
jgi:hypothetical protein